MKITKRTQFIIIDNLLSCHRQAKVATGGTLTALPRHGLTNIKNFITKQWDTQKTENMETLASDSSSKRNLNANLLNGFTRTFTVTGQKMNFFKN